MSMPGHPVRGLDLEPLGELPRRPLRILIADDEHLVAVQMTHMIASMGYVTVGPVGSGNEAVRLSRVAKPDLALLDIRMPDGDGLDAARRLLDELLVPSIILSAYSDEEYVQAAMDCGVFAYLIKPVEENQLRVTLEVAWGRYGRFIAERAENEDLRQKLEDRKVVEKAKWLLVQRSRVDEQTAMRLLSEFARDHREPLASVARRFVRMHPDEPAQAK